MVEKHIQEYQTLLNNIPGGVLQCMNDEFFTIIEANQGFFDILGFSGKEITDQFHNQYLRIIHSDDRKYVLDSIFKNKKGEKITLNYRTLCKNGDYKWLMDSSQITEGKNNEERIFSVLLDITESRHAREELRLSLELHKIIMDQAADIIFEWDIQNDTIAYSSNWIKKFGYQPRYKELNHWDLAARNLHPDDAPKLREAMLERKKGSPLITAEARIRHADGHYIWCRFRATEQFDVNGVPLKVIGIITDIDKEKQMIDDLRQRAERDALSGLYNREETERRICSHLKNPHQKLCALFMIDIDDFKQINDSQGHLFGDAVLAEIAAEMKKFTRQTDVIGRIGGDEFTIFLKDIPSSELAEQKARKLITIFQTLFQKGKQTFNISCSIGVAVYPKDGNDFQTLYHNADLALYQAKYLGKNQYVMFDSNQTFPVHQIGYSSLGTTIESDQRLPGASSDLINSVFQILYNTIDIDQAIQLILEIVGQQFDVSRAYIFESSNDGIYAMNTYEWCNTGISPQKENLQKFPFEKFGGYQRWFKDGTVFYCRDIHQLDPELVSFLEAQNICSLLQCAILENETFYGFVGFDECTGMRLWTKEEINILSLISHLITTFLLKKRSMEREHETALRLNAILDIPGAYIYAIEQDTYKLLYLNHNTRKLDPAISTGMTCYQAFFKRNSICKDCLLSNRVSEIYNPQYDIWTKVHITSMKWDTFDAYLLSCFDISEYKKDAKNMKQ